MARYRSLLLSAAVGIAFITGTARDASAITRVVVTDSAQCPADTIANPCYTDLGTAITNAVSGDSIEIRPGTYTGNFSLSNKSVSLYGTEAAATFLSGGGSNAVLSIDSVTSAMSVRKVTFRSAATGIFVRNASSLEITNNIFDLGTSSTAIQTENASSLKIDNNTFYRNAIGVNIIAATDLLTQNIRNNIFSQNAGATAILPASLNPALISIQNNLFFGGSIGPSLTTVTTFPTASDPNYHNPDWKGNISTLDPLFVNSGSADVSLRDFHLKSGTPCQNSGNSTVGPDSVDGTDPDIGAYGGSLSDTIPFVVSALTSTVTSTAPYEITLSWAANAAYTVKGYKIRYGHTKSRDYTGNDAIISGSTVTSPYDNGTSLNATLTVSPSSATLTTPVLNDPEPRNERLLLSWTYVNGATGYHIYYSPSSAPTATITKVVDGGNTITYTLPGLINGETYNVAVSAIAQPIYYLAVTVYDTTGPGGTIPGERHESDYSAEKVVPVGPITESGLSEVKAGMPELLVGYPDLPNSGCFIATAAYGSVDAFPVRVLREFRDVALLTNGPGRAFVGWYYRVSPPLARFINDHPVLKPFVRAALAPAVAGALLLQASASVQAAFLLSFVGALIVLRRRTA